MMEADRIALCGAQGSARRCPARPCVAAAPPVRSCWAASASRCADREPARRSKAKLALPSFRGPRAATRWTRPRWRARRGRVDAALCQHPGAGAGGAPAPSASKSAVSRRFVQLSQEQLAQWLARPIGDLDLPVVMIDGIHYRDRVILLALGIDAKGDKHVLGLREGSTEATRVVASLLSDLVERGLDADRMRLWVIDGGKALRKAIVQTFGQRALIQRCQEHKRRNVLEHSARGRARQRQASLEGRLVGLDADLARKQLDPPGLVAAGQAPRRCGQPARRPGRDADGAGAGHHRLRCTARCARPTRSRTSTARWRATAATSSAGVTGRWCCAGSPARSAMRPLACASCAGAARCEALLKALDARRSRHRPRPQGRVACPTKEPSPLTVQQRAGHRRRIPADYARSPAKARQHWRFGSSTWARTRDLRINSRGVVV